MVTRIPDPPQHREGRKGRPRSFLSFRGGQDSIERFERGELIGEGCMGRVYRATDMENGQEVALKIPFGHLSARLSIRNEARALSRLDHPGIVRLVASSGKEPAFVATGYLEGVSLSSVMARRGTMAWDEARPLLMQMCQALEHAHSAGVIHKDVKPDNIFLTEYGVKLLDFGVASICGFGSAIRSFLNPLVPGDLAYSAPEVYGGSVVKASDVYSLGLTMHRILTGFLPMDVTGLRGLTADSLPPESLDILRRVCPPRVEGIIGRATMRDARKRYRTAYELGEAIGSS
jgi:serine/threonine protein kinase